MAKKKKPEEEKRADSFALLFCTLSLILLAFFIFLNTLATVQEDRVHAAIGSIRRNFALVSLGGLYKVHFQTSNGVLSTNPDTSSFQQLERQIRSMMKQQSAGDMADLEMEIGEKAVHIRMSQRLLFGDGMAVINPRVFPVLDRIEGFLETLGRPAVVEGHCNAQGGAINWEISSLRAAAVARYLSDSAGFPAGDLTSRGLSHFHTNTDDPVMARRVEIVVPHRSD